MRLYGLIGFPLKHSFSKKYFEEKFQREHISHCSFVNFELETPADIAKMLQQTPQLNGFAVTIPHKKNILPFLHASTPAVLQMNACNCVKIVDGKLYGHNTDVLGFEQSLKEHLQPHHTHALILGTGGAAAAVEYVLQQLGIYYKFVSRQANKEKSITYTDLSEAVLQQHTLIINTTPLGTFPAVDTYPHIPYKYLTTQHYLYDLVYNPSKTLFLQKGEEQGAVIKNGHEMLTIQAEENWRIWNE